MNKPFAFIFALLFAISFSFPAYARGEAMAGDDFAPLALDVPSGLPTKTENGVEISIRDIKTIITPEYALHYYYVKLPEDATGTLSVGTEGLQSTLEIEDFGFHQVISEEETMPKSLDGEQPIMQTRYAMKESSREIDTSKGKEYLFFVKTAPMMEGQFSMTIGKYFVDPFISACGIINESGIYEMNKSVNIAGATCFTISAPAVTLNCKGFSITGANSANAYGIASSQQETHIENCAIFNFRRGILLGSAGNSINRAMINSTSGPAAYFASASGSRISNSTLRSFSGESLFLNSSSYISVMNNTFESIGGSSDLVHISWNSPGNTFFWNTFANTTGYYVIDSNGENYFDNYSRGNLWPDVLDGTVQISGGVPTHMPGLYYGSAGSGYPYSNATSAKVLGNVVDNGPFTPTYSYPCKTLSEPNNVYIMDADAISNHATCFTITAPNVTLDCNGHEIIGDNSSETAGISLQSADATIKNCRIEGFQNGTAFWGASSNTVTDTVIRTMEGGWAAYFSPSSSNNKLYRNTFASDSYNQLILIAEGGTNNTFHWNNFTGPGEYVLDLDGGNHYSELVFSDNLCYQEFANESTSCGGLGTGSYGAGYWEGNVYDAYFYVNYSKPMAATNGSMWRVKHGDLQAYNINLPHGCFSQEPLQLRILSSWDSIKQTQPQCFDGSSWLNVGTASQFDSVQGNQSCEVEYDSSNLFDGNWETSANWVAGIEGLCGNVWADHPTTGHERIFEEAMIWDKTYQREGNIWGNVISGSVNITGEVSSTGFPALYIGDRGSGYPYNSSNSQGKVNELVMDQSPLTPKATYAWNYVMPIYINSTVSSSLANFPARVDLNTSNSTLWNTATCTNVRFMDEANTTFLNYDLDSDSPVFCGNATNNATFWVSTNLAGGELTKIYAYLGNIGSASRENEAAVWKTAGYYAVYHGNDLKDSAGSSDLIAIGTVTYAPDPVKCRYGSCFSFDTSNAYLTSSTAAPPNGNTPSTESMWAWRSQPPTDGDMLYDYGTRQSEQARMEYYSSGRMMLDSYGGGNDNARSILWNADQTMSLSYYASRWMADWHLQTNASTANLSYWGNTVGNGFALGAAINGLFKWGQNGVASIDEARFANVTHSNDWLAAEYAQTSLVGAAEQLSPPNGTNTTTPTGSITALASPPEGGTVSGTAYNLTLPAVVNISAVANPGYQFQVWGLEGNCSIYDHYSPETNATIYGETCGITGYFNESATAGCTCGVLSEPNSVCNLTQSIANAGTCFNVTAENVTIECNGWSIEGINSNDSYGIYTEKTNTTIRNCNIANFATGIYFLGMENGSIENTTAAVSGDFAHPYGMGIRLYASFGNRILSSRGISKSNYGIFLYSSSGNNITDSEGVSDSGIGIALSYYSDANRITNSSGTSSNFGILLESGSEYNMIANSTGNGSNVGIFLSGSPLNEIMDSTAASYGVGIYLAGSSNNAIRNTIAISGADGYQNGSSIFLVQSSNSNLLANNTLVSNSGGGDLLYIDQLSAHNMFYWNNFTATSGNYMVVENEYNDFNASIAGAQEGNLYANVMDGTVPITGTAPSQYGSGLFIGASGSGYPYNEANSGGKVIGNATDHAPLTPFFHNATISFDDVLFNSSFESGNLYNVEYASGDELGNRNYQASIAYPPTSTVDLCSASNSTTDSAHWWAFFRMENASGKNIVVNITDLAQSDFDGRRWQNARFRYSFDFGLGNVHASSTNYSAGAWHAILPPNDFWLSEEGRWVAFNITVPEGQDTVWVATANPYTVRRRDLYLDSISSSPYVSVSTINTTTFGLNLTSVTITDPAYPDSSKIKAYIMGQQHANNEPQGSWYVEGAINYLLNETNPAAAELRRNYIFKFVPVVNVDGVYSGIGRYSPLYNGTAIYDPNRCWDNARTGTAVQYNVVNWTFWDSVAFDPDCSIDVHGSITNGSNILPGYNYLYNDRLMDSSMLAFSRNISANWEYVQNPDGNWQGGSETYPPNIRQSPAAAHPSMMMENTVSNFTGTTDVPDQDDWMRYGVGMLQGIHGYYQNAANAQHGSLMVNASEGGAATGSSNMFTPPANLTINATAMEGYYFINWTTDCDGALEDANSPNTLIQVNSARACFAQANFGQYGSLMVNATEGGTATGSNAAFIPPGLLAINATAGAGYYFVNWTVTEGSCEVIGADSQNAQVQINNTLPCNVQANFALICRVLSIAGATEMLDQNLSSSITCFTVAAPSVTIDCNGYSIVGDNSIGSAGVQTSQFNTTIRNCEIKQFETGAIMGGSAGMLVNSRISGTLYGIRLAGPQNSLSGNKIESANGIPLYLETADYNRVFSNTLSSPGNALLLIRSGLKNTFYWNNFTGTDGYYVIDQNLKEGENDTTASQAGGINFFDAKVDGYRQGNIWANVIEGKVDIKGNKPSSIPGLYIGSSGTGYPYGGKTSLMKVTYNVVDYAPLTPKFEAVYPSWNNTRQ